MLSQCLLLLSAATLVAVKSTPINTNEGRIVGGKDEVIENMPWQVSLQDFGGHMCGGSIYNERIIVTAGHCAPYVLPGATVRVGSTKQMEGGTVVPVVAFLRHEKFNFTKRAIYNDVAVLLLSSPLDLKGNLSARAIPLAKRSPAHGAHSTVTGWGRKANGPAHSEILQTVDLEIVGLDECRKSYIAYGQNFLADNMICAASPGKDSCEGDSGGPLVSNGELVGIVSFGKGCALPGYPGVYADVAELRDWIVKAADRLIATINKK